MEKLISYGYPYIPSLWSPVPRLIVSRSRGYVKYSVYLPRKLVEKLGWEKGDELVAEEAVLAHDVVNKKIYYALLLYRKKDMEEIQKLRRER